MIGRKHRTKPCLCPYCGYFHDAASAVHSNAAPKPGDLTTCINCGKAGRFNGDLSIRPLSDGEFDKIASKNKRDITLAQVAIAALNAFRRPRTETKQ